MHRSLDGLEGMSRTAPVFTNPITRSMDDSHRVAGYTARHFGAELLMRGRSGKRSSWQPLNGLGRPLSSWTVGPGPKSAGRWFANLTDRHTGGHVHLSSLMELGPFGMLEDLVTQLPRPDRTTHRRVRKHRPVDGKPKNPAQPIEVKRPRPFWRPCARIRA